MLVYHFRSKEALTTAILEQVAARWMSALQAHLDTDAALDVGLKQLWYGTLRDPANRDVHVLALEAWAIGLASGNKAYRPFLKTVAKGWIDLLDPWVAGRRRRHKWARVRATLIVAAIEGLLLHQLTDKALPVDAAFEELLAWIRQTNRQKS